MSCLVSQIFTMYVKRVYPKGVQIILPIPKGAVTDTELPGIATLDEGFIDFRTKS